MSTGYASGMRKHRIRIQNRKAATDWTFGFDSGGVEWEDAATVWAAVDFVKGLRAMREGAIDVYGIVMVRMNYNSHITMRSRIIYDNECYQILPETFHADRWTNTIQFNAQVVINSDNVIVTPTLTYETQDLSADDTLTATLKVSNSGSDIYTAAYTILAGDDTVCTGSFSVSAYSNTTENIAYTLSEAEIDELDGYEGVLTATLVLTNATTGDEETTTTAGSNVVVFTSAYLFGSDGYGLFSANGYALVAANQ